MSSSLAASLSGASNFSSVHYDILEMIIGRVLYLSDALNIIVGYTDYSSHPYLGIFEDRKGASENKQLVILFLIFCCYQ